MPSTADRAGAARRPNPNDRFGLAMAAAAAGGLGLATAMSRLAYDGGTNALTVATTRSAVALIGLLVFCMLSGRSLRVSRWVWLNCAGLGLQMAFMFYSNIGAVQYIPVGLTALLFYTYPPIVAVILLVVVRQRVPAAKVAALVVAFAGLAVMLGVSLGKADPRGVALALGAGVICAWNAVWLTRRLSALDMLVVTTHMTAIAFVVLFAVSTVTGSVHSPVTGLGWLGLVAVVTLQGASIPLYFVAMPRIGALKSAMISNVQPVMSILAAFVLFNEVLGGFQLAGGAMVLGGIAAMQWLDSRGAQ